MLVLSDSETPVSDAAVLYARAGLCAITVWGVNGNVCACGRNDCRSPGKHPIGVKWQENLSSDPVEIAKRFAGHTGNIGIALGRRHVVIDADGDDGVAAAEALGMPPTLTQLSGSGHGRHYIFALREYQDASEITDRRWAPGLDVKCSGMIVVSPSRHASGGQYRWLTYEEPAALPDWLYERVRRASRDPAPSNDGARVIAGDMVARVRGVLATMPRSVEGQGGSLAAFRAACRIAANIADEPSQEALLAEWNQTYADPPWSDRELAHKLADARASRELESFRLRERPRLTVVKGEGEAAAPPDWHAQLHMAHDKDGNARPLQTAHNIAVILRNDPAVAGRMRHDTFLDVIMADGVPWEPSRHVLSETEWVGVQGWLGHTWGMPTVSETVIRAGIAEAVRASAFSSAAEWMNGLTWDGVARVGRWLETYLGVDRALDFARLAGQWWLVGAVARVMEPGCQMDGVLVLEGPQGGGKSSALRILGGEWFTDQYLDLQSKDGPLGLRGRVIVELAELGSMRAGDVDRVKAFLTQPVDRYRAPYAREVTVAGRTCVFAATTNETEFLRDTEHRRFWCVRVERGVRDLTAVVAGLNALRRDRDQIWAEAVALWKGGARRHPDAHQVSMAASEASERRTVDPWEEAIMQWLEGRDRVTTLQIAREAVHLTTDRVDGRIGQRIARVMNLAGWKQVRTRKYRFWVPVTMAGDGR